MSNTILSELPLGSVFYDPSTQYEGEVMGWRVIAQNKYGKGETTLIADEIYIALEPTASHHNGQSVPDLPAPAVVYMESDQPASVWEKIITSQTYVKGIPASIKGKDGFILTNVSNDLRLSAVEGLPLIKIYNQWEVNGNQFEGFSTNELRKGYLSKRLQESDIKPTGVANDMSCPYILRNLVGGRHSIQAVLESGVASEVSYYTSLMGVRPFMHLSGDVPIKYNNRLQRYETAFNVAPILNIEEANSDYIIYSAYDYEDETLSINITLNDESIYIKDGLSGGTFHQKIDNSKLIEGVNTIEIKVVDSSNKTTSRTIKITKEPMDLPKVGSEVVIDNVVYTVKSVLDNGDSYKVVLDRNVEKNNIMECELVDQPVNITAMIKQSESSTETKHNMKHISSIIKGDEAEDMYILEEDFRYITFKFEIGENEDNFVKKPKALFEYKED